MDFTFYILIKHNVCICTVESENFTRNFSAFWKSVVIKFHICQEFDQLFLHFERDKMTSWNWLKRILCLLKRLLCHQLLKLVSNLIDWTQAPLLQIDVGNLYTTAWIPLIYKIYVYKRIQLYKHWSRDTFPLIACIWDRIFWVIRYISHQVNIIYHEFVLTNKLFCNTI